MVLVNGHDKQPIVEQIATWLPAIARIDLQERDGVADHIRPPTAPPVRLHRICADVDRVRDDLTATTQAVEARSNGPCAGVLS